MNKYIIIFIVSVFFASISQIMLKKSANIQRKNKMSEYLNFYVIGSYSLLLLSTILTLLAYKEINLSLGYILESLGYIIIPLLSYIVLKEKLKKNHILGILLIIIGISIFAFL